MDGPRGYRVLRTGAYATCSGLVSGRKGGVYNAPLFADPGGFRARAGARRQKLFLR
jgi:hypothetical protein